MSQLTQQELDAQLLRNFKNGVHKLLAERRDGEHPPPVFQNTEEAKAWEFSVETEAIKEGWIEACDPLKPLVHLAADVVMGARFNRWIWVAYASRSFESPLERVLSLAVHVYGELDTGWDVIVASCGWKDRIHREERAYAPDQISVCHQHWVGKYRADLLVTGYESGALVQSVAVEVDGHDFHERTKAQASHDRARDREFQRRNLKVFRFTGSDVFRDPMACAIEVVDAAMGKDQKEP